MRKKHYFQNIRNVRDSDFIAIVCSASGRWIGWRGIDWMDDDDDALSDGLEYSGFGRKTSKLMYPSKKMRN